MPETEKRIKGIQSMQALEREMRGQKAYVDGLFLSFQAQTVCRERVPQTHHELVALAHVARDLANEIDTLLGIEQKFQEGLR